MPVPTWRVPIKLSQEGDGAVLVENWPASFAPPSIYDAGVYDPVIAGNDLRAGWPNIGWRGISSSWTPHFFSQHYLRTFADDGLMGGRWARIGISVDDSAAWAMTALFSRTLFDISQPITAKYKCRVNPENHPWSPGAFDDPNSLGGSTGDWYSGEGAYDGSWYPFVTPGHMGLYQDQVALQANQPFDFELSWPGGWYQSGVGGSQASMRYNGTLYLRNDFGSQAVRRAPVCLYLISPYTASGAIRPRSMDLGPVRIWGKPLWGFVDHVGAALWDYSGGGAGFWDELDNSGHFGGIGPTPDGAPAPPDGYMYAFNHAGAWEVVSTKHWQAQSPIVAPETGYRPKTLWFLPQSDGAGGGYVRLYARDARTGALVPDSEIPGNSLGLHSQATNVGDDGIYAAGTLRVDLTGMASGRDLYFDVRGYAVGPTNYWLAPRLSALYLDFEVDPSPVVQRSIKVWNGERWVDLPLKHHNGSIWLPQTIKRG